MENVLSSDGKMPYHRENGKNYSHPGTWSRKLLLSHKIKICVYQMIKIIFYIYLMHDLFDFDFCVDKLFMGVKQINVYKQNLCLKLFGK